MPKIIIVYASMSGNTEEIAEEIAAGIREAGIDPVVKSVMDVSGVDLVNYDGILLGAYTWGDGDLPDEFEDFYDELEDLDLSGRKSGAFGSADSSYTHFGAAVDTIEERLAEIGTEKVFDGLKIEFNPTSEQKKLCRELGAKFAAAVAITA